MRVKLVIAYDGTNYCGWQVQPNKSTVQGQLETAIKRLTGTFSTLVGSGRTDAGVHALGQVAHFDLREGFDIKNVQGGLNYYLPKDITVLSATKADNTFNARKSAIRKTYDYRFYFSTIENPLLKNRALCIRAGDILLMKQAATKFIGTKDFYAFMSSGSLVKNTLRNVDECFICLFNGLFGDEYYMRISANGFLYNMVRKIFGLICAVGAGVYDLEDISKFFVPNAKCKEIAPPHGLYLKSVEY